MTTQLQEFRVTTQYLLVTERKQLLNSCYSCVTCGLMLGLLQPSSITVAYSILDDYYAILQVIEISKGWCLE